MNYTKYVLFALLFSPQCRAQNVTVVVGLHGDLYSTISGGGYGPGSILAVVP
jgi:hypothetical protein